MFFIRWIGNTEHFLSTVYSYPNSYLSPEVEYNVKFVEKNRKPNFIVRTHLVSTVHTLNDEIAPFFCAYDLNIDDENFRKVKIEFFHFTVMITFTFLMNFYDV